MWCNTTNHKSKPKDEKVWCKVYPASRPPPPVDSTLFSVIEPNSQVRHNRRLTEEAALPSGLSGPQLEIRRFLDTSTKFSRQKENVTFDVEIYIYIWYINTYKVYIYKVNICSQWSFYNNTSLQQGSSGSRCCPKNLSLFGWRLTSGRDLDKDHYHHQPHLREYKRDFTHLSAPARSLIKLPHQRQATGPGRAHFPAQKVPLGRNVLSHSQLHHWIPYKPLQV